MICLTGAVRCIRTWRTGVAAALAGKQGGQHAGSWPGLRDAGSADQDEAAGCGDGACVAGVAIADDGRDDQGHR
jgi:hypothetical protein